MEFLWGESGVHSYFTGFLSGEGWSEAFGDKDLDEIRDKDRGCEAGAPLLTECHAWMVENCGMEGERLIQSAADIPEDAGYYSLIIAKDRGGTVKDGRNKTPDDSDRNAKDRLALVQTKMVAEAIEASCPEAKCELVPLMTKGDKILKTSLVAFGGKGAFVEEFEQSLLNGDIDLAVHSAKDMPMDLSDGLCIGAVLKRGRSERCLCDGKGPCARAESKNHRNRKSETSGADHGARGCGMPPAPAETLIRDWKSCIRGEYDGIILAAAGLNRLGLLMIRDFPLSFWNRKCFSRQEVGDHRSGKRKKGSEGIKDPQKLNDKEAERALFAERKVLRLLGAGCTAAVGVYAKEENGTFWMGLMRGDKNGLIRRKISGAPEDSMKLAELLVKKGTEGELPAGKAYLVGEQAPETADLSR